MLPAGDAGRVRRKVHTVQIQVHVHAVCNEVVRREVVSAREGRGENPCRHWRSPPIQERDLPNPALAGEREPGFVVQRRVPAICTCFF